MGNTNNLLGEQNKYARFLVYFVVLYGATFIFLDILRIWGFGYGVQDIGIYRQVIWNTARGRWFQTSTTFPYNESANWLGFHFDVFPILFSTVFYKIFPTIETLSVIHVSLITLTSLVIYKTCRAMNVSPRSSFFWGVIYLIHPMTVYHALFSLQETSFSIPLLALGYFCVVTRRFYWLLLVCFLLVLTKEHHGITVFGFGLTWLFYNKNWRQALTLCIFGIVSLYTVIMVIVPELSAYKQHFMLSSEFNDGTYNRYAWLKLKPIEAFKVFIALLFSNHNLAFMSIVCVSFAFLPFAAFFLLFPVAGDFLVIILSNSDVPRAINFYYSAPFIPAGIIATVYVLKKIAIKHPKLPRWIKIFIFTATVILLGQPVFLIGSKLLFVTQHQMDWTIGKNFQEVLAKIPRDKVLMTDHQSGSTITDRDRIMLYNKYDLDRADYVLLRISPIDFSPASKMQNTYGIQFATDMVKAKNWELIYWKYPYALFGKGMARGADVDGKDFVATVSRQIENYNKIYSDKKNADAAVTTQPN